MKKNKMAIIFIMFICVIVFAGCTKNDSVVRIHIRANSNCEIDQRIKLEVRDEVIDFITPLIADCNNSSEVKNVLENNLQKIESISDSVLFEQNFDYVSRARISNEYFPSREYNGDVYPADYYDALIIELGSGKGDNWWCVAYPPLCFVGEGDGEIQYRSKLIDMINKFIGR
jgi:stage II sporulation protein R